MSDDRNHMLDLNTLEREGDPGPFRFKLGEREYTLLDAQAVDFRALLKAQKDILNRGDAEGAIALLLPGDDREEFFANNLPTFKLEALFKSYSNHYGLTPSSGDPSASS